MERKQLKSRVATKNDNHQTSGKNMSGVKSVSARTADNHTRNNVRTGDNSSIHTGRNAHKTVTPNPLSDIKNDLEPVYGENTQVETNYSDRHAGGRPTKYSQDLCEQVVMWGREGYSKEEIASELNVCVDTLYEWAKVHSEFSEALKKATTHSQAWHERKAKRALDLPASAFNAGLWGKIMSARFPATYRETVRSELSGPNGVPIPVSVAHGQLTGEALSDFYKQLMDVR